MKHAEMINGCGGGLSLRGLLWWCRCGMLEVESVVSGQAIFLTDAKKREAIYRQLA